MENYRSKSYADGRHQIQSYNGTGNGGRGGGGGAPPSYAITSMQDLRCYSASYATSVYQTQAEMGTSDVKFKKGKSTNGSISKRWSFNDPELQRKKRVASYKVYAVEGKSKGLSGRVSGGLKKVCCRDETGEGTVAAIN
ncbi:ATP-dependent DNA helicase [Salix suchowensis]|nr:ATP-dependent DNA helicase [Salix suchowensis]